MELKFKCPDCQNNDDCLEVTRVDCVVYIEVEGITKDGALEYLSYDHRITNNGKILHYSCQGCGLVLIKKNGDIITKEYEVINWLNKNVENEELNNVSI